MRRALRIGIFVLLGIPLLLVLAVAGGLVWANSEGGRATIARLAGDVVPGLTIEGLSGPLPSRIGVERLVMADENGPWLELDGATIALDLPALLHREARITALTARRVALHRLPPGSGEPPPPPDPDAPLIPALPDLPLTVRLDRLAVDRIELGEPVAGVAATLRAEGEALYAASRLSAKLAVTRLDAPAEIRADIDLAPGADRLTARIDANEPPGGLVATLLGLPDRATIAHLTLDGPASGAALDLRASLGDDITLTANGTVRAAPDGAAGARLSLSLAAAPLVPEDLRPTAMPLAVDLDAGIDAAQRVTLTRLEARAPIGTVAAEGSADLAASTVDVSARVEAGGSALLGTLVPDAARWDAIRATARATGPMATPNVTLDLATEGFGSAIPQVVAALGPTPRLSVRATVPDRIESLTIDGAALHVTAEGAVGETLDATLRATVADLAPLVPGLVGGLQAELHATGPRNDPSLALTARGERIESQGQVVEAPALDLRIATPLSAPRAEGTLRATYAGLAASVDLRALPEGEKVRLESLAAAFGPARLNAQGLVDPQAMTFVGDLSLNVPDLAPFATLAGTPMSGRVGLTARLDLRDGMQGFDATLDVPQANIGGTPLGVSVKAAGTLADMEAGIEARAQDARLTTRARVTPDGAARRVEIPELLLRRGPDSVRTTAPARILVAADGGVSIEALALTTSRGGTLRAEGRWGPEQADLRATLAALPVAGILALAAPGQTAEGTIAGEARITGPTSDPQARFRIEATGLRNPDPSLRGIPAARVIMEGTGSARAADVRLEATAGNALRATGTARLPNGFAANAPVTAQLDAQADVAAIAGPLLAAGAQRVTGRATLNASVAGTLGAPQITGRATLSDGTFRDLAQGVTLNRINAVLRGEGDRITIERLEARTPGNGTISGSGTLSPAAEGLPADITITARNARPLRSDLVTGIFDADLRLAGQLLADSRATGRIAIRRLDITVPEQLPRSVQTLDGVRETGRRPPGTPPLAPPVPPGAASAGPQIALAIDIAAPRAVFVRGRGIDAEFGGTLALAGTATAPVVNGGLTLRRGEISVFDRRLTFTRGTIAFDAGTLVPTLDFLASARAREVTANVTVTGPANDPKLEFSSTPELPQDEILSRLLFDRRANELSPFQLAQLAQVLAGAAGIEVPGAGGILDRIRRTLALDRLSVNQDSQQGTDNTRNQGGASLETGRYVAEGVYVGVRQSSEGGPPRVGVQVDVLPRVRLQAETGGNSSAGDRLGVTFEFEY
ncbi:translocation/assembly module TamB domain-containing protein [Roseomonas sp. HJA6]|uniref:Translocation/assembly module TamB domain-containing protein n=1 Tax=Roseomonas alba TaxID=2846776 RepID=A0ABS7A4K4_9PROT|nr:translocation/assembly module TamB domain-containing protein [Neoroseomonas alba]MBW6397231.1 translocation/assembly module TamB domain-containing protein [Neoroseomonas alba]